MGEYRHETVELGGLNHLAEAKILLLNGTFAGLAGGSRRLGIFNLPWLLGFRHFRLHSTLTQYKKAPNNSHPQSGNIYIRLKNVGCEGIFGLKRKRKVVTFGQRRASDTDRKRQRVGKVSSRRFILGHFDFGLNFSGSQIGYLNFFFRF